MSSSYIPPAFDGATIITNMSVWEDLESPREFAYRTVHSYFVKSHKRWFDPMDRPKVVLWWVEGAISLRSRRRGRGSSSWRSRGRPRQRSRSRLL